MIAGLFLQTFRWAKVWGICGGILMIAATSVHLEAVAFDGIAFIETLLFIAILSAFYGALAGFCFAIVTTLDSSPGARLPLGIIVGGLSGFLCMRLNVGTVIAPIAGCLLGFILTKTETPRSNRVQA